MRRGAPLLVVGGAGGARIITGVLDTVINVLDFDYDLAHAVDAERIDDPMGTMTVEDARVAPGVIESLVQRGHVLARAGEYDVRPRGQAAGVSPVSHVRGAVSDPRTEYAALAQR